MKVFALTLNLSVTLSATGGAASVHTLHAPHCGPSGNVCSTRLQLGPGGGGQALSLQGTTGGLAEASLHTLHSPHCGPLGNVELMFLQFGPGGGGQVNGQITGSAVGGAGASLHTLHSLHSGPLGNTEPIFLQFGPGAGGQPILVQRTTGTGADGLVIYKQS